LAYQSYDTEQELAVRKPDDTHQMLRINTKQPYVDPPLFLQ
jgi:hypothetical protein